MLPLKSNTALLFVRGGRMVYIWNIREIVRILFIAESITRFCRVSDKKKTNEKVTIQICLTNDNFLIIVDSYFKREFFRIRDITEINYLSVTIENIFLY